MPYRITPAYESDLPRLWTIEQESFHNPWSNDMLQQEITKPQARFRVLREATETSPEAAPALGFCLSWVVLDELHIHQVAVTPSLRRQGLGRLLLQDALHIAQQEQVVRLYLEVRASNQAALGLYQSFHFETVGVRRKYYQEPVEDAVVLVYEAQAETSDGER